MERYQLEGKFDLESKSVCCLEKLGSLKKREMEIRELSEKRIDLTLTHGALQARVKI